MTTVEFIEKWQFSRSRMVVKMTGMAARSLRARGFYRVKGKPVFLIHTVGLGGIYVYISTEGYRLRIQELGIDRTYRLVSNLLRVIDASIGRVGK